MKRLVVSLCALFAVFPSVSDGQEVRPVNSGKLYHEIAQLQHLARVLYVAAHPDDENTRLLSWLVNDQNIETAYLSLTRGDGGQNILGNKLGKALGLIRTYELLEARKIDGADQYFSRVIDFGYSKTAEETFHHWNQEELAREVAYIYRLFRPDIVICRFPPDERAGHGQHAASAIIAEKAYSLSGNGPARLSKDLPSLAPWQPKRLLWNTYRFGSRNTTSEDQFQIKVGNYSPWLGMGLGELAGKSRSIHRSQGAGTPGTPGLQKEYFKLVAGDPLSESLFDGVDISWKRIGRPDIGNDIEEILNDHDFLHPENSLTALLRLKKKIESVKDDHWREVKQAQVDQIILHASGFWAEAVTSLPTATAGSSVPFSLHFVQRAKLPVTVVIPPTSTHETASTLVNLKADSLYRIDRTYEIPETQPVTNPYWLRSTATNAEYPMPPDSLFALPIAPNNLVIPLEIRLGEEVFKVNVPLSYKKLDPLKGDVVERLRIIPKISVEPASRLMLTDRNGDLQSFATITAHQDLVGAQLSIYAHDQELTTIDTLVLTANTPVRIPFYLPAKTLRQVEGKNIILKFVVTVGTQRYDKNLKQISYDHIPTLQYLEPATAIVVRNNWGISAQNIGYISGAGDFMPEFLKLAGLEVKFLSEADFRNPETLQSYDAIITGIRALNTNSHLAYQIPLLLDYVRNGGVLLMQYNTRHDLETEAFSPYPLELSRKRVTEEDAPVEFLLPEHPLLHQPNQITKRDFEHWVQERGLYFPDFWSESYDAILGMHDTGENSLEGALLYTTYGKGVFIYTSLSFFRQLPAGNPGAIRLLMNLISGGR